MPVSQIRIHPAAHSPFELLPSEVLDQVARALPLPDRSRLGVVSKRLRAVSLRDALWEPATKPWSRLHPASQTDVPGGLHAYYCARKNQLARSLQGALCLQTPLGRPESASIKTLIWPRADGLIKITVDLNAAQAVSEVQTMHSEGPSPTRWRTVPAELLQALGRCAIEGWGDDVVLVSADMDRAVVMSADLQTRRFEMRVGYGQPFCHVEPLGPDLFALIDESRRLVAYRSDGTRLYDDPMQLDDVCLRSRVQRGRDGHLVFCDAVGRFTTIVDVEKSQTHRLNLAPSETDGVCHALLRLRAFFAEHGYTSHASDAQINEMIHPRYVALERRGHEEPMSLTLVCGTVLLSVDSLNGQFSLYRLDFDSARGHTPNLLSTYSASSASPTKRTAYVGERYLMVAYGEHEVLTIDGSTGRHNVLRFERPVSRAPSAMAAIDGSTAVVCTGGDLAFVDLSTTPSRILGTARSGNITRVTNMGNYRIVTNDAKAMQALVWDLCEPAEETGFSFFAAQ